MSVLHPIPGMVYLQAVVPRRDDPPPAAEQPAMLTPSPRLRHLLQVAVDVGCRIRPLTHLTRDGFTGSVRSRLAAHLRTGAVSGPVRIVSVHIRDSASELGDTAEVFGTTQCAGRIFAFTGLARTAAPERLLKFRIVAAAAAAPGRKP